MRHIDIQDLPAAQDLTDDQLDGIVGGQIDDSGYICTVGADAGCECKKV